MALVSCAQKQKPTEESVSTDWKTYNAANYSIGYPDTWDLDDSGRMGMDIQVLSPQASPEDAFRENVNVVIQDLKGQPIKDLDQYTAYSLAQIKTMMKNSKLVSNERKRLNEQDYHRVVFNAEQGDMSFTFEQYYLIQKKKAYVLTLTCEADSFDTYSHVGESILASFSFN
jgi:hypothetical protein